MARPDRAARRTHRRSQGFGDSPAGSQAPARDIAAMIARFPRPSSTALAISLIGVLCSNGWLLWRVIQGELHLTGIVLLVLTEAVLLSVLAAVQRRRVPPEHRMQVERHGLPDRLVSAIGLVVGIGGAYVLWAVVLKEADVALGFVRAFAPWHAAGLDIALAITLAFAIAGWFADSAHYRRAGPPLVSSIDMEATARRLIFVYGALVIAIPMIGTLALAFRAIPLLLRGRDSRHANLIGGVSVIAVFFGTFFVLTRLVDSGPPGWAAVYLWGKVLVEGLFVMIPVIARRMAAQQQDAATRQPATVADRPL